LEKLSQKFDYLSHGILVIVVVIDGYGGAQHVPTLIQRACKMASSFKRNMQGKLSQMWIKAFTFPLAELEFLNMNPGTVLEGVCSRRSKGKTHQDSMAFKAGYGGRC
jgi:hypothetical protein